MGQSERQDGALAGEVAIIPQLSEIIVEFEQAQVRLHELSSRVSDERWSTRADPARWSVAECIAHLNLPSEKYLPLIDAAIQQARRIHSTRVPRRYRRDAVGWLLWRTMGPPVRLRTRTLEEFIPSCELSRQQLLDDFDRLQAQQIHRVRESNALPLDQVRVTSPFNQRISYNLYACFSILSRHQHRHLWQAGRVWDQETALS